MNAGPSRDAVAAQQSPSTSWSSVEEFVRSHLPPPPSCVLAAGVGKLRSLLRQGGVRIVDEFAKENLVSSEEALGWLYHQRLSLVYAGCEPDGNAGGLPSGDTPEAWSSRVSERTSGMHRGREVLAALEERFTRRLLSYGPFLYRKGLDEALEPLECLLIEQGGLKPTGFRWIGGSGGERADPTRGA